jgi:hypothetical protein
VRVLLISEGSHEGNPAEEKPQALRAIVQRVLPARATYEWLNVRHLPRGNPLPGKGGGHFKLALKAMWHATKNAFDAVILVTDADGHYERIKEFDEAQESDRFPIPRALGIPVEAFDAWILADHQAMGQVFGKDVPLQRLPESAKDPKGACESLLEQCEWAGSQAEFYAGVCACADLEIVADRCPKGFKPFLERLRKLQAAMTGA